MITETIVGVILTGLGAFLFLNNKNIAKGASAMYQKFYTEKNLTIMFRIVGLFLAIIGIFMFLGFLK